MENKPYYTGWRLALLNLGIGLGTFIQILDASIANVAIPYIAGNLSVSADEGTWVITSFAASNAIVLPLTGWLSSYFGTVRLFIWSVILFSIVSVLCGLSTSLTMLVTLRVLQGAVAGSLIPLSQSLIVHHNPSEKTGGALGFWATIVIVAPVIGPVVGGYLTYNYSWPWIFYINLPIGLFSAFVTWYFLRDRESEIVRKPIDWIGLFLLAVGVGCLQVMLDRGKDLDWFNSNIIVVLTIISVISIAYFVLWNRLQENKIVDFSFFKYRNYAIGTFATTVGFLIYFGSTVTVPLWLQTEQGYTPVWAGVAIAPVGIAPFFLSAVIGRNLYRFDLRVVMAVCFLILAFAFFYQANFTTEVDLRTIMLARFIQGFGIAIFFLPLVQLSFGELPREKYPSASGLYHFIRILVGSGFGTSLSIYLWWRRQVIHHSRLTEIINYDLLPSLNFDESVVKQLLDIKVEQEAYMLASNDLSWLGAWLFIAMIPLIFLTRSPKIDPRLMHAE